LASGESKISAKKPRPRAIDLFCGCGGLTLGLKQAGFQVVGAVDSDAGAVGSYRANHKDVTVWEADIRELLAATVLRSLRLRPGQLDLLAGCPPCQGFSDLRTRNRSRRRFDMRNSLIDEFLRFVRDVRPKAVLLENVPALADHWRFRKFVRSMKHVGYSSIHAIQDASDFGVPQRRRRLIYIALLGRTPVLPREAGKRRTVKDAIARLPRPGASGDRLHDLPERRSEHVRRLIKLIPKNGGSRFDLPKKLWLACHRRSKGFYDVYGRLHWDAPAPTITSGCHNPSKGRFLHPSADRTITLREAAVLQGFPRRYRFANDVGKEALATQIGNALPPRFVAAHARAIISLL
jgi:DNA (cytosine-5)-methyltransferase 1